MAKDKMADEVGKVTHYILVVSRIEESDVYKRVGVAYLDISEIVHEWENGRLLVRIR